MSDGEDLLAMCERHVAEGEARVARQQEIIAEMERDGHTETAARARNLLATFCDTLALARHHLEIERAKNANQTH